MVGTSERPDLPLAVSVGAGAMGLAIARRLGQRYRILLADMNKEHVEKSAALLCDEGHDCIPAVCDVSDPKAILALADKAAKHGPLRVLCHVVGLSPAMAEWQKIVTVDLLGVQHMANAMLPLASQGTSAIFISSNAAHMLEVGPELVKVLDDPLHPDLMARIEKEFGKTPTSTVGYCLAKFAVNRLCQRLAPAWGKQGARINSLSPGQIATPMAKLEWTFSPVKHELLAMQPVPREGTLMEICDGVEFLASDKSSFISGTDLRIDGGLAAAVQFAAKRPQVKQ